MSIRLATLMLSFVNPYEMVNLGLLVRARLGLCAGQNTFAKPGSRLF